MSPKRNYKNYKNGCYNHEQKLHKNLEYICHLSVI